MYRKQEYYYFEEVFICWLHAEKLIDLTNYAGVASIKIYI